MRGTVLPSGIGEAIARDPVVTVCIYGNTAPSCGQGLVRNFSAYEPQARRSVSCGIDHGPIVAHVIRSHGVVSWCQQSAGSGGSQGFPVMASRMASSAVMPWAAAESR